MTHTETAALTQSHALLPIPTADTFGACSTLFELGGMIVIHDPSGCNSTYTTHDEPRWYRQDSMIYISALTQLNVDAHNRIPTTSARLVRRLVRDYQFRGSSALKTLRQWPDVRKGEEQHIFPFQEDADVMFNSALIYELGVLKKYAKPLLEAVPPAVPEHIMARKLLDFCAYFDNILEEDEIPNNSLLREFIGKSVFFK